jgi:hypothetical protein
MLQEFRTIITIYDQAFAMWRKHAKRQLSAIIFLPFMLVILAGFTGTFFSIFYYLTIDYFNDTATFLDYNFMLFFSITQLYTLWVGSNMIVKELIEHEFDKAELGLATFQKARGKVNILIAMAASMLGFYVCSLLISLVSGLVTKLIIMHVSLLIVWLVLQIWPIMVYTKQINSEHTHTTIRQLLGYSLIQTIALIILTVSGLGLGFLMIQAVLQFVPFDQQILVSYALLQCCFSFALFVQAFLGIAEHLTFVKLYQQANGSNIQQRINVIQQQHLEPETN